jgi:uncharacterized protein
MNLEFEWDPAKARANEANHGVDFEEAISVFRDPLARIFDDEDHSESEPREIIIGYSAKRRLLLVCFTDRGLRALLISARKAMKLEPEDYGEKLRH